MRSVPGLAVLSLACLLPLVLTGCEIGSTAAPTADAGLAIHGSVHGGQQPIVGAEVYLLAANTTGYGQPSVSKLSATSTGYSNSLGAYVPTAADGSFTITGDYSCTPNTQVYLYSLGGSQGGIANPAAGLLAALGNCPSSGNFLSSTPFIAVNEVSTVAAAYAFAGFATDATDVSSSGTALAQIGIANAFANATNLAGISTGAALATTPAGNGTVPQAEINTLANILASCINSSGALTGPTNPTACYTLFNDAQSAGSSGTMPSDTATAAINIAHNPGANIAALYGLSTADPPFGSALGAQPNDFTISLSISTPGVLGLDALVIDGLGNAWFVNSGSGSGAFLSEYSNLGAPISPATGYIAAGGALAVDASDNVWIIGSENPGSGLFELNNSGGLISPSAGYPGLPDQSGGIAFDVGGNVWVSSFLYTISEFSSSGAVILPAATAEPTRNGYSGADYSTTSPAVDGANNVWTSFDNYQEYGVATVNLTGVLSSFFGGGVYQGSTSSLAIDHSGNVWAANFFAGGLSEFSNSGAALSPSTGYTGGGLVGVDGLAIDGAGNIWLSDLTNHSAEDVTEFSNSGSPISPSTGYIAGGGSKAGNVAVDGSGDVWIASGYYYGGLVELIGAATPVVTPIAVGTKNNTLGARP
jgi:hypothetical protein